MAGEQQQFFLKWNDFQVNMMTSFRNLRNDKSFTDVTLACEGQTCKAHKMVLSACSPYFKALLQVRKCFPFSIAWIDYKEENCLKDNIQCVVGKSVQAPYNHTERRSVQPLTSYIRIYVRGRSKRESRTIIRFLENRGST